jgi:hypothetical protein
MWLWNPVPFTPCFPARCCAQDAMNVFLGVYEPWRHEQHLWDMETDVHIHNAKVAAAVAVSSLPRPLQNIVAGVCGTWWAPSIQAFAVAVRDTGVKTILPADRFVMSA